jgi:hypothetical protein
MGPERILHCLCVVRMGIPLALTVPMPHDIADCSGPDTNLVEDLSRPHLRRRSVCTLGHLRYVRRRGDKYGWIDRMPYTSGNLRG